MNKFAQIRGLTMHPDHAHALPPPPTPPPPTDHHTHTHTPSGLLTICPVDLHPREANIKGVAGGPPAEPMRLVKQAQRVSVEGAEVTQAQAALQGSTGAQAAAATSSGARSKHLH